MKLNGCAVYNETKILKIVIIDTLQKINYLYKKLSNKTIIYKYKNIEIIYRIKILNNDKLNLKGE